MRQDLKWRLNRELKDLSDLSVIVMHSFCPSVAQACSLVALLRVQTSVSSVLVMLDMSTLAMEVVALEVLDLALLELPALDLEALALEASVLVSATDT